MSKYNFATNSIHGKNKNNPEGAINPPIFMTSSFCFDSLAEVDNAFNSVEGGYIYTRGNNPTLKALEEKMAILSQGSGAIAFSSGMAGISTLLFSLLNPGDSVVTHNMIYGSSYNFLNNMLPEKGIEVNFYNLNSSNLAKKLSKNTDLIYFETPVNPTLKIIDIEKVVDIAQEYDITVVMDNTFATPYLQRPLEMGVDYVVHSATKYISGHGDAVGGIVVAKDADHLDDLRFEYMSEHGGVMSPFNAWLMLRGLKTLKLRMKQHQQNADKIARFLDSHRLVKQVYYPGLKEFSGNKIASRQMDGFGGMLSFELKLPINKIEKFLQNLDIICLAVSLGDAETLIEVPARMTHRNYEEEKLQKMGITDNLLRISAGLEECEDLIEDLARALDNV